MTRKLGAWDCEYCDSKGHLGNVFDCPSCGKPRSRGVRFYQIPNAPVVTQVIAEQLGSGGPNWYCKFCDSGNKDNSDTCWSCAAKRGDSPSHEVKYYDEGEAPTNTEEAEEADPDGKSWVDPGEEPLVREETLVHKPQIPQEKESGISTVPSSNGSEYVPNARPKPEPKHLPELEIETYSRSQLIALSRRVHNMDRSYLYRVGGVLLAFLLIFGIYKLFFDTSQETVVIDSFSWSRNVVVKEYQVVEKSSWSTHPSDAYNITKRYLDTGRNRKVHDGWETVFYTDTCYETVSYQDTCSRSVYQSKTCSRTRDNGDGSFSTESYECGSYTTETYSCTQTRQEPYTCTKTRQEEIFHYEDIYDWYYEYNVDRWVTVANYPTSGIDRQPFYSTDFVLSNPYSGTGTPELGQQAYFELPGDYFVTFYCENNEKVGDEGYFTREYSLGEWEQFSYDTEYFIEVNRFGAILSEPSLTAQGQE